MVQNTGNALSAFTYAGTNPIRVIDRDGSPWFVVSDIRRILGLSQHGKALAFLASNEKEVIVKSGSTSLGGHGLSIISESGLYKLVLRSDKPAARAFQDWVTRDVLPAIRKDGAYIMGEEKVPKGEMDEDDAGTCRGSG